MAVVAFGGWRIARAPVAVDEPWFLPLVATDGATTLHIVAAQVSTPRRYGAATLNAIARLGDFMRSAPTIFAGDLNNNGVFDHRNASGNRFSDVVSALDAYGLTSAWHLYTGEKHGKESVSTLFHLWKEDRKFHIDYVFIPRTARVEGVAIGTFAETAGAKISDHAPVVVDVTL